MDLALASLLGVIQGLTEFLPVSSSAHLILARAMLGWDAERFGLAFDVACHLGTLLAVVWFFRQDVAAMARSIPRLGTLVTAQPDPAARLVLHLAIGTVPTVAAVLLFGSWLEGGVRTPGVAATMLAVVALALVAVERLGRKDREASSLSVLEVALIGCAQAAALVPGVSRSGATIATAMACGVRRDAAARFVFVLGIPAIFAAAVKEGLALVHRGLPAGDVPVFGAGVAVSAVVGYVTIRFFLRYLASHSLDVFAWYRLALSATVFVWWLAR